jgi:hypothetical protein
MSHRSDCVSAGAAEYHDRNGPQLCLWPRTADSGPLSAPYSPTTLTTTAFKYLVSGIAG